MSTAMESTKPTSDSDTRTTTSEVIDITSSITSSSVDPTTTTSETTTTVSSRSQSARTITSAPSLNDNEKADPLSSSSSPLIANGRATNSRQEYELSELKIISQLKNIEKINEQRRIFLSSNNNDSTTEYASEEKIETAEIQKQKISNGKNGPANGSAPHIESTTTTHTKTHLHQMQKEEETSTTKPTSSSTPETPKSILKSPTSPPPKPPMLSRMRSSPTSPPASPKLDASATGDPRTPPSSPITSTIVHASTIPEPLKVDTVELRLVETSKAVNRPERPMSLTPAKVTATAPEGQLPKPISANHYERLVEELKCPGCASPMKAPILLCQTGHSICEQCTRILMLCPLCKEPFTGMRSRTIEALCSKAHFRCCNASGGCNVRLQIDLLSWHEKQCIYKPMKCFMGRVWGNCQWAGREAFWKDHLENEHSSCVFTTNSVDLIWNMRAKQKPLRGYYVFQVYDEMFNFYEVYDRERILFTMTCTSTVKDKKHNYAFEVTILHEDNEALAITQKYPVHSEYDSDILLEGTCVSIQLTDLAKFINDDKMLHYRVRVVEVKSPRKLKLLRRAAANGNAVIHPVDFQQTQIEGVNLKEVPNEVIVTRKLDDLPYADSSKSPSIAPSEVATSSEDEFERLRRQYNEKLAARREARDTSDSDSDPEFEAFIAKRWGTPQLHFNRKYLKSSSESASASENGAQPKSKNGNTVTTADGKDGPSEDRDSVSCTSTSYKKRMSNSLRKSFRSIKSSNPFAKKSPEKIAEN